MAPGNRGGDVSAQAPPGAFPSGVLSSFAGMIEGGVLKVFGSNTAAGESGAGGQDGSVQQQQEEDGEKHHPASAQQPTLPCPVKPTRTSSEQSMESDLPELGRLERSPTSATLTPSSHEPPDNNKKSMYFSELLENDETVELLTHGPFTISAGCGVIEDEPRVRLFMTVTADSDADEWVYGFPDFLPQDYYNSCLGTTSAGTVSDTCIVWSTMSGTGTHPGAFTSLSGYYIGLGGSSTIGFNKEYLTNDATYQNAFSADDIAAFPTDCAISGELTWNRASGDDP